MIGLTVVTLMSYSRVVSVALALLGVGLQTLIFFHPSLSVIQKKKKKKKNRARCSYLRRKKFRFTF